MPYGDGTGPAGMGPMTGRAAGFCAGYPVPGYMNQSRGQGFFGRGMGRGGGRGRRNQFYATGLPGWQRVAPWPVAGMAPMPPMPPAGAVGQYGAVEQELDLLKRQAEHFQGAIGEIQRRIQELQGDAEELQGDAEK